MKKMDLVSGIARNNAQQIFEESTVPPPTNGSNIDDESNWIYNQLKSGVVPLLSKDGREPAIVKGDVVSFLDLMHVPFIAMYRKGWCRSLFVDSEPQDDSKPTLTWHKAIVELDRKWLLLQKRKKALELDHNRRSTTERCSAVSVNVAGYWACPPGSKRVRGVLSSLDVALFSNASGILHEVVILPGTRGKIHNPEAQSMEIAIASEECIPIIYN
ncbi:hypothetical protein M8C21_032920 [Ambrosia artemisiifolia]|uniref:Uncharacterized protein n=1 Tax=Ambrosia artemisiifolia TaxID=4212 RepID=A0AAD5GH49_AMBAR|nr:hypothetical protein M8C21_032920 [Ambrosia artemisiifolia]